MEFGKVVHGECIRVKGDHFWHFYTIEKLDETMDITMPNGSKETIHLANATPICGLDVKGKRVTINEYNPKTMMICEVCLQKAKEMKP